MNKFKKRGIVAIILAVTLIGVLFAVVSAATPPSIVAIGMQHVGYSNSISITIGGKSKDIHAIVDSDKTNIWTNEKFYFCIERDAYVGDGVVKFDKAINLNTDFDYYKNDVLKRSGSSLPTKAGLLCTIDAIKSIMGTGYTNSIPDTTYGGITGAQAREAFKNITAKQEKYAVSQAILWRFIDGGITTKFSFGDAQKNKDALTVYKYYVEYIKATRSGYTAASKKFSVTPTTTEAKEVGDQYVFGPYKIVPKTITTKITGVKPAKGVVTSDASGKNTVSKNSDGTYQVGLNDSFYVAVKQSNMKKGTTINIVITGTFPAGAYTAYVKSGYQPMLDYDSTLTTGSVTVKASVPEEDQKYGFKVIKTDDEGKVMAGIKLGIQPKSGSTLKDAVFENATDVKADGNGYTFKTGGKTPTYILNVNVGSYELREIEAPNGYKLDNTVHTINVTASNSKENKSNGGVTYKVNSKIFTIINKPLYTLRVEKVDEKGNIIKTNEAQFKVTYPNGTTTKTITTKDGVATISDNTLVTGEYKVEEVKAPKGYVLNPGSIPIKLSKTTPDGTGRFVHTGKIVNEPLMPTEIIINKVDKDNKDVKLQGAVFELYKKEGTKYTLVKEDKDGNPIGKEYINKDTKQSSIAAFTTDINGQIKIKNVPTSDEFGKGITYALKEIKAPDGYKLIPGYIDLTKNGENTFKYDRDKKDANGNYQKLVSKEFTIENEVAIFDLALKKFIYSVKDTVNGTEGLTGQTGNEEVGTDIEKKNNVAGIIDVKVTDEVMFAIQVFNQGKIDGFASEITDYIPDGMEFDPNNETNKKYGWSVDSKDSTKVKTSYLTDKVLKAYEDDYTEPNKTYKKDNMQTIYIVLKVNENAKQGTVLINWAEISKDKNECNAEDIDSIPDDNRTDDRYIKDNDIDGDGKNAGDEDDHDPAGVYIQIFDLALRKWINSYQVVIGGTPGAWIAGRITADIDYPVYPEDPSYPNHPEQDEKLEKIELTQKQLEAGVEIKVKYNIMLINEGEIPGFVTEVTDYLPEDMEFYAEDNDPKFNFTVEERHGRRVVVTDYLKDTLLNPKDKNMEIEVVLRYKVTEDNMGLKTNYAEISKDKNDWDIPDIDSTPDNYPEIDDWEDDTDAAPIIVSVQTGMQTVLYFVVTLLALIVATVITFVIRIEIKEKKTGFNTAY